MIKKYVFVFITSLCSFIGFGQVKLAELTFESAGGYTTNPAEFVGSSNTDYFTRTDGSNIGNENFTNIQGNFYFAAQDTDFADGSGVTSLTLEFSNINITGYNNLELRVHLAEDDDGTAQDWDANTSVHINGSIDSGTFENLIWVESSGGTNTAPSIDTDYNGDGDGTEITDSFTQFLKNITGTGGLLDIIIEFENLDAGDEDIAIDNIEIWGTPSCTPTHSITNFSPTSGPENTQVTITGTGFTPSTSVEFSGGTATIVSQTATELIVLVPNGISTGIITVTEASCDVISSSNFTLIDSLNTGCEGSVNAGDLFISEVTDATFGSLTYVEIYNGTGSNITDLSNYSLEITFNGNSNNTTSVNLSGPLADGAIHVVSTPTSGSECPQNGADGDLATTGQGNLGNGIGTARNDADCITLYNTTNTIDVWGVCNDKNWREDLGLAIGDEGFDFRRLASSNPPSTTFDPADWNIIDWTDGASDSTCSTNDYSDIGHYTPGLPPSITSQPSVSTVCSSTISLTIAASEGLVGNHPLTYQWYYVAPGDTNWNIISNNSTFSGANNWKLDISNPLDVLDYQFYCQVREDDATCYKATKATKIDLDKTTWNGSSWDNGTPTASKIAVINGNYNTFSNNSFTCCQLKVNSGFTLTISDTKYVEVENNALVKGTLLVQTQGSFVQNNDLSKFTLGPSGSSQMNKKTANLADWHDYTYWSSSGTNISVGSALPISIRRFYYNSANYLDSNGDGIDDDANDWVEVNDATTMTPGLGYIASHTPIGFEFGPSFQYNFIGEFNNGPITPPFAYNATNPRHWNLLGNPYPCAIDINDFWTENVDNGRIEKIVYLWSHHSPASSDNIGNDILNYSISDYALINGSGPLAGASMETPGMYIPSGQSFFVNSLSNSNGDLTFNNGMRIAADNANDLFFRTNNTKKEPNQFERIWLNLTTDNGVFNQVLIAYHNNATNNYDGLAYDAEPVYTGYANLYTSIEGENRQLAIQGKAFDSLNEDEVIPLGFNAWIDTPTVYTISINNVEGVFLENNTVFLNDKLLNITHNLTEANYSFTSEYGAFENRFEILFNNTSSLSTEENTKDNSLKIIELENDNVHFILDSNFEFKNITITDILGRTLYNFKTNGNSKIFNLNKINTGTYIAKITLNNNNILTKKTVKK